MPPIFYTEDLALTLTKLNQVVKKKSVSFMHVEPHIYKDYFFTIIQNRLFRYADAIWGPGGYYQT